MTLSSGSSALRRTVAGCAAVVALVVSVVGPASAASAVWNVARIGAPATANGVKIAVVDSGIDAGHPAFGGRVVQQIDFVGDGKGGDPNGHGTHVAGTAAGGTIDCGAGAAAIGVAPTARLLSLRVLDEDGSGTVSDVAAAIRRAADEGAAVVNLSLGSDVTIVTGSGQTLREAIEYAWNKGSIPVLAAGNSGLAGSLLGSGYDDELPAVVVTATTATDSKPGYATAVGSARWGIAAPGGDNSRRAAHDVLSAWPGEQCGLLAGTSMAAPHVSGALAVLRARGLSPAQAVDRLLATAEPLSPRSTYGSGLVDLTAAMAGLSGGGTATATPRPTAPPTTRPASTSAPTTRATPDSAPADPGSAPAGASGTSADEPPPSTPSGDAGSGSSSTPDVPVVDPPPPSPDGSDETGFATDLDDPASSAPTPSSDGDDEAASGLSSVVDEDSGRGVSAPVAGLAGAAVLGLWVATGRAAIRLRS